MKRAWMILGLAALLSFAGCGDQKADQLYEEGISALEAEDYEGAVEAFDELTALGERLPEAYRGAGIAWLQQGAYPEAIAAFSRSLNYMDYDNEAFENDVTYYLAQARLSYGETDKAISLYSDILKKGENSQCFYLRGKAYMIQGEMEKAAQDFSRALEGCTDYDLYINIYQLYADQGNSAEGLEYLDSALSLEPETGEDYCQRGRIYCLRGEYEEAADELIQAIDLEYSDAMLLLGSVYLEMDDSASARSMYQEYLAAGNSPARAYNGLALCDIHDGQYDNALKNIASGLEEADEEEQQGLLYNEIAVYEYQRDFETAKTKMAEYLERYPDDQEAVRENQFLSTR